MDLWIRSQDKERLVKVDKIELYENKDNTDDEYKKCAIYEYTDNERQYLLGIYKTKERALEVLDEIQDILKNNQYVYKVNGLGEKVDIIPNQIFVYEMPKE